MRFTAFGRIAVKTVPVNIDLDFFVPENDKYLRYSESFQETAYPLGDVESALIDTGFEILGIYDDDSFEPVRLNSERAVFAVRKGDVKWEF